MLRRGFSLIEMMVVLVVMAILLGLGMAVLGPNLDMNKANYQIRKLIAFINSMKERAESNVPNTSQWIFRTTGYQATAQINAQGADRMWNTFTNQDLPFVLALRVTDINNQTGNFVINATAEKFFTFEDYPHFSSQPYDGDNTIVIYTNADLPGGLRPPNRVYPYTPSRNTPQLAITNPNASAGAVTFDLTDVSNVIPVEELLTFIKVNPNTPRFQGGLNGRDLGSPSVILVFRLRGMDAASQYPVLIITTRGKMFPCEAIRFVTDVNAPRSFASKRAFGILLLPSIFLPGQAPDATYWSNHVLNIYDLGDVANTTPQAEICMFDEISSITMFHQ